MFVDKQSADAGSHSEFTCLGLQNSLEAETLDLLFSAKVRWLVCNANKKLQTGH
jgi:hypothetical protein